MIEELGRKASSQRQQNQSSLALSTQEEIPISIPGSFNEAIKQNRWRLAIEESLNSLIANDTWRFVKKPKNVNLVSTKWVFKLKTLPNGQIDRYKARLVARGFTQREGIDFFEVFSGVVRLESLRILLAVAAILDLEIEQMDFTAAYTQCQLEEDIFLGGIDGLEVPTGHVIKLNRSLEGLRQSGRVWNKNISKAFKDFGLSAIAADNCVFVSNDKLLIVALYVDDLLIFSSNQNQIRDFKIYLTTHFRVRDIGAVGSILSLNITRDRKLKRISVDQEHYINELIKRYNVSDCEVNRIMTPVSSCENLLPKDSRNPEAEASLREYQSLIGELN